MKGSIIITENDLRSLPIFEFERPLDEKFVALKVITGYDYDDKHLLLDYGHHLFALHLGRTNAKRGSIAHDNFKAKFGTNVDLDKVYEVQVWDHNGNCSIHYATFRIYDWNQPIPQDYLKLFFDELDIYVNGNIRCSDCDKIIKRDTEIAGHYFAGRYCQQCWDGQTGQHKDKGGWSVVAERETYE